MDSDASGSQTRDDQVSIASEVKRMDLFLLLKRNHFYKFSSLKCNQLLVAYILNKLSVTEVPAEIEKQLKTVVKVFVSKILSKWRDSNYTYDRFEKNNNKWLKGNLNLPQICQPNTLLSNKKRGRPKKLFSNSCERTKQRDIKQIVTEISSEKLCFATETSLVKCGKRTAAQVVKLALTTTPRRLKKMKQVHFSSSKMKPYSPEEALALIVDLGLGKEEYITIQRGAKAKGANIYPSYNVIAYLKKQCYPPDITITETEAQIPLQNLLDLTIQRLVQVQCDVLVQNIPDEVTDIDAIYKWGLDGSGGHSIYKQNFSNNSQYADSNIILCTIVPLELSVQMAKDKKIYWKNLSPSSTRYCRPIAFKLKRETNQTMTEEYQVIQSQVVQLQPTKIWLADKELSFRHIPVCTMLDGKTCNVLTDTSSSQTCNVCKATPKDMNDLSKVKGKPSDSSTFKFGISVLHAYLRSYEYLLHIAYKLETQEWQARGSVAKEVVKQRKNMICSLFYNQMGLVVDQPKQGGGNSNDGNTARKFFDNPDLVSQITGLNRNLISRFANILCAISSGHYIDTQKFESYCFETAEMCVSLYGWYKMSATVHKLLIHGSEIIKSLPLPVGQFSEDVLEAGHKDYKNLRLFHSRKTSRIDTNTDILHWMLISSDPIISSYRKKPKKKRNPFSEEVRNMLKIPDFLQNSRIELDRADDIQGDIIDDDDIIGNDDVMEVAAAIDNTNSMDTVSDSGDSD